MPVFVDTNLLVYRFDTTEPEKQAQAEVWHEHLWRERTGRLSIQVLQELYSSLTRKLDAPMKPAEARTAVRALHAWNPIPITARTIEGAWRLEDHYSLSWWDALIVAAAQIAGCRHLLTEDLSHGQDYDGVRVVNPFRVTPGEFAG